MFGAFEGIIRITLADYRYYELGDIKSMSKEKTYITLWIISLLFPLLVLFFMYSNINLYVVFVSLGYKFVLGLLGVTAAAKNWKEFKEDQRIHRRPLIPFYILAVIVAQVLLLSLLSIFLSGNAAIATGSGYAIIMALWLIAYVLGTYAWEVEFFKMIENSAVRIAFAISTPVLLFLAEAIVILGVMAL